MGDREYNERRKVVEEEEKKEKDLETKIRMMRKDLNKKRDPRRPTLNQPQRKRQKMDDEEHEEDG